jgi:hypothetical protein
MNRRHVLMGGGALAIAGAGASYLGIRQMGSLETFEAAASATRAPLPAHPEAADYIRYATLAPNGHNTQPWTFRASAERIEILPDFQRRTPVVDPDDHHLYVSLGCAAENLALAAAARGRLGEVSFDDTGDGRIVAEFGDGRSSDKALFQAIPVRQSTRAAFDFSPASASDIAMLRAAADVPGVALTILQDAPGLARVVDMVAAGNSTQMADPAFMKELKSWMRFNAASAAEKGDGLFSAATGNPQLPDWLGSLAIDWFLSAKSENEKYAAQIRSSAGVAIFAGEKADHDHWVRVGRACQRFALQATALGMKHAFINQPVEVPGLRAGLAELAGWPGQRPDIVMRFGRGPTLPYSARRPATMVS